MGDERGATMNKEKTTMTPISAVNDPNARWISIQQAARMLELSETQIRARMKSGEIYSARVFGRHALLEESVKAYRDRAGR
jgi:excisionase family DNA binding protein